MVIPLVIYGMKALAKLQVWTTPLWLVLFVIPMVYLLVSHPDSVETFFAYQGADGDGAPSFASMMLAAGVCLSLMAQIAEQIDYLRFMPPRTDANRKSWWRAVILAGPGWVIFGAIKQIVGLFVAVYIIARLTPDAAATANEPVHQFLTVYEQFLPGWAAMTLAVILVVISQIKINVTNAYSGSLAWTNSFTRLTKVYPGRLVFVLFNLAVALLLMELNMFSVLNTILGFYANCAMAWVVTVAADIVINKGLLKISPTVPEFRRGMLYAINPVGFGSVILSAGLSILVFFGAFGSVDRAVLADRGDRVGAGADAADRGDHQGQVLPAARRRRHSAGDVRRGRQPVRRDPDLPRLPPGVRAPRHGQVRGARRLHLLAGPVDRQAQGACPARPGLTARTELDASSAWIAHEACISVRQLCHHMKTSFEDIAFD